MATVSDASVGRDAATPPFDAGLERSPGHVARTPTMASMTDGQRRILDEVERLAKVYAMDLPVEELYRRMGGVRQRAGVEVSIEPAIADIARISVREERGAARWIQMRLTEPVSKDLWITRFGPFEAHLFSHRDADQQLVSNATPIDVGAGYAVRIILALPDESVPADPYRSTTHVVLDRSETAPRPPTPKRDRR